MLPAMAPLFLTRRALLRLPLTAGAVAALGACTADGGPLPDPQVRVDVAAVQAALATERTLLSAATRLPDAEATTVLRRHVDLLESTLPAPAPGPTPRGSGAPTAGLVTEAALAAGLSGAADSHLAALPDVSGAVARMLASIAASDRALAAWTRGEGS
jgi:hypothetical protein